MGKIIVTREMALDAGDPTMEGATWDWESENDVDNYVQFICDDCGATFDAPSGFENPCPACDSINTREVE